MSFTVNAFDHAEWHHHALSDFSDFAELITECNAGEDAFSGYGEWFFIPDEPLPNGDRVIYFGSWGNDNCPGASMYTNAEIFDMNDRDDAAAFDERIQHWQSQAESIEECE